MKTIFREGGYKMRANINTKNLFILSLLLTSLASTGCFRMGSLFGSSGGSNNTSSVALPTGGSGTAVPSVMEASQTMASLGAMTGVKPSNTTINTFTAQLPNYNVSGDYTQVGQPWLLSQATLVAEFCNDATTQNAAKIFPGINFNGAPSQFSGATLNGVAGAMCRSFLRHDCSAAELSAISSSTASFITNVNPANSQSQQTKTVAIALCTGVLSSYSASSH